MKLLAFPKDINVYLLILDILFLIVSFLFLNKKKCSQRIKDLFIILYTLTNIFLFNYLNNLFNNIFNFSNISIKFYLIIVVITYIIFIYTINKKNHKLNQKIINYLLFIITNIILLLNTYIILSIKTNIVPLINIENKKIFNNITIIIFIIYLIITSFIYIINNIIKDKKNLKQEIKQEEVPINTLTIDELLNYDKTNSLYINGVDCSIIFNDSNYENIIKNYQILSNNIKDKMVNGYTLDENIMLKNICTKLNTNNLMDINLANFNILNKISVEEYNLLKKIKL